MMIDQEIALAECYVPSQAADWEKLAASPSTACFGENIKLLNLLESDRLDVKLPAFALVGYKSDEGLQRERSRNGANEGPVAIRHKLAKLPIQKSGIHCYDVGDVICINHNLKNTQSCLAVIIDKLLGANITPIVIGGSHELAWGHYQGIIKKLPVQQKLGIINFDAHLDIHPLHHKEGDASTPFYQIALQHQNEHRHFDYNCIGVQHAGNFRESFEIAKKFHTKMILADDLHQGLREKCFDFIDRVIDENDAMYVSISLDVFSAPFAPGVSAVQPLGLEPWHVIPLLRQIASSAKAISYDIAELIPKYDSDHRTAKLAAMLIYEIVHHHVFFGK